MRLNKKILNNLSKKYATLAIGAASILGACNKGDDVIEQHDTIYSFKPFQYEQLDNLDQIRASADSVQVRHIYFRVQSIDEYGWEGINLNGTIKHIDAAFDAAQGKGRGMDTFERVTYHEANLEPVEKLLKYGYMVTYWNAPTKQR